MKKIILFLALLIISPNFIQTADASFISDKSYRTEQNKSDKKELKQIKDMLKVHNLYANNHDFEGLKQFYSDNYINNDGFNKEVYFKNIKETWDECKDLTYSTKILSIEIDGDFATVNVEENATGTIFEKMEIGDIAGEIHAKSSGIYHLVKINDRWLISGETLLTDESSLLYGDARFMNMELSSPYQVSAGENYTASLRVDADEKTFVIASIDNDPVTYPAKIPQAPMRTMPQSHVLERILKANNDNINEYSVASLAISKAKDVELGDYKVYVAGLACLMKRVNVVPVNKLVNLEEEDE